MTETTFSFIPRAARSAKPRKTGITEIRGPYYSAYGPRHLADLLETVGAWIDGIKYAGGSFALMPPAAVKSINKLAHDHDVYVSTGGWIENVLRFGPEAVDRYVIWAGVCKAEL
jgi:phosphosulfolactate synthase (CoM biosynthesis protein A)